MRCRWMQSGSAFPVFSPKERQSKECRQSKNEIHLKWCWAGGTDLLLAKLDIHALALGINDTSNLSGAQRVQMKRGPQPKYTASELE